MENKPGIGERLGKGSGRSNGELDRENVMQS